MTEQFFQFIWKFGLFDKQDMRTVQGEPIEVVSLGLHNTDAGPDFTNARLKIGNVLWVGNVEIHLRASDWQKHEHQHNAAYDNVILHVVRHNDCPAVENGSGAPIPVYEIKYDARLEQRYQQMMDAAEEIPCRHRLPQRDSFLWQNFLTRLSFERLEQRTERTATLLAQNKNDWDNAFLQLLFRAFGFGINADPFEQLAQSLTNACIAKHKNSLLQLEALLLGQAGFLNEPPLDDYQQKLQQEYTLLQAKFSLTPLPKHVWKFLRIRPDNFPTLRLAQLAGLLHTQQSLFAKILEVNNIEETTLLFAAKPSPYWDTHYSFGKSSPAKPKPLGEKSIARIIANVVITIMFQYGKVNDKEEICNRAVELLEQLPPEKNAKIAIWEQLQLFPKNMLESQALLQLKNEYCDKKRCLHCTIGKQFIEQA